MHRRRVLIGTAAATVCLIAVVVHYRTFGPLGAPVMLALEFTSFVLLAMAAVVLRSVCCRS